MNEQKSSLEKAGMHATRKRRLTNLRPVQPKARLHFVQATHLLKQHVFRLRMCVLGGDFILLQSGIRDYGDDGERIYKGLWRI